MNEIPERAFVIAERMKNRQNSEAEIRAALAEFELSEKQIKEILKRSDTQSPYIEMSDAQQNYFSGRTRSPFSFRITDGAKKQLIAKPGVTDGIKDSFLGFGLKLLIFIGLFALCTIAFTVLRLMGS